MKLVFVLAIAAMIIVVILFLAANQTKETVTTAEKIPSILATLSRSNADPAFAVFMFKAEGDTAGDAGFNIQFSMEHGKPGFDWVLTGPRNIADEARFVAFAEARGYRPQMHEENNVKYLRVEQGDLALLCTQVITDLYKVPATAPIGLMTVGI